ncbi:MAG: ABC transporter permease [Turicibacter sp.]|nr:ABC transporter permease [Turicibacter sp.]
MDTKKLSYPYLVWITLTILVPMLLIFLYSIIEPGPEPLTFQFSLAHYLRALDGLHLQVLWGSFVIALASTAACLLIGYPAAWFISRLRARSQSQVILLLMMPMWINMLLRSYAWMTILSRNGILNSVLAFFGLPEQNLLYTDFAVILGMVYNFLPFMILPIYTAILKVDANLVDAARDLGASPGETFLKVIFPLSIPGIITGITMVFLPSMSSFVIPQLLGGGQFLMIGNLIERQYLLTGNWHFGSALAMLLMAFILLSVWLMKRFDPKSMDSGEGVIPW